MIHRVIRRVLLACACWTAISITVQAQELLRFGTDKGRISKLGGVAGSAAVVSFAGDYLEMNGPNYWDSRWQFNQVGLDLSGAEDTDVLVLEVQGVVKDERPWIRLMLCSPDWKDKAYWRIDLAGMTADGWTTVVATSCISAPLTQEGKSFSTKSPIGNVLFYAKAEKGNNPWQLRVRSMSLWHAADAAKLTRGAARSASTATASQPAKVPATPLLLFGSAAGKMGEASAPAGSAAKVEIAADYLQISGANTGAVRCQCLHPTVDLSALEAADHLQLELAGEAPGEQPTLQLTLLTADGQHGSTWVFNLSDLKQDGYILVPATTSMAVPAQCQNNGFHQGNAIGSLLFIGAAKAGSRPWTLRIKSLQRAPATAAAK